MKEKDFYQISLKLLVRNGNGEVLALKAHNKGSYAGYYDLPGGRIDTDEFRTPFVDILAREVGEEIGGVKLNIHPAPVALGRHNILANRACQREKDIHVLYIFFLADYAGGDVTISDEHEGLAWLNLNSIDPKKYFTSGILEGVEMYLQK